MDEPLNKNGDVAPLQPFPYLPLTAPSQQLRLLDILRGDPGDPIILNIRTVDFWTGDPPHYEALSYAWGPQDVKVDVRLQPDYRLSITPHLEAALKQLRHSDKRRTVWIDAISIDQSNKEELGYQVSIMDDVYEHARCVIVWLGSGDAKTALGLDLIAHLGTMVWTDYERNWLLATDVMRQSEDNLHWMDVDQVLPYDAAECAAIESVLSLAWFERLWVRQELILAQHEVLMVYGDRVVPWPSLRSATHLLRMKRWAHECPQGALLRIKTRLNYMQRTLRPLHAIASGVDILMSSTWSKCSDPRDKVYANLGCLRRLISDINVRPNYFLSAAEVYRGLTLELAFRQKRLDVLEACELSENTASPSWVPLWSNKTTVLLSFTYADAHAASTMQLVDPERLRVSGLRVGTIASTINFGITLEDDYVDYLREIIRIAPLDHLQRPYKDGGSAIQAYRETLVGGTMVKEHAEFSKEHYHHAVEELFSICLSERFLSNASEEAALHDLSRADKMFLDEMAVLCPHRSFATTDDGLFGLVPASTKPGDSVYVILGCSNAMILRKQPSGGYQLVGSAYIHGLHQGQAILGELPEGWTMQAILGEPPEGLAMAAANRGGTGIFWEHNQTGEKVADHPGLEKFLKEGEELRFELHGTSWHYPWLTAERLRECGVDIVDIELV